MHDHMFIKRIIPLLLLVTLIGVSASSMSGCVCPLFNSTQPENNTFDVKDYVPAGATIYTETSNGASVQVKHGVEFGVVLKGEDWTLKSYDGLDMTSSTMGAGYRIWVLKAKQSTGKGIATRTAGGNYELTVTSN
jgi:hypothetical protein